MAQIRQRKEGGVWLARFFDINGKRVERSTGETDEAEAFAAAREMEAVARAASSAGRFRDRLEELNRAATGVSSSISFRAWADSWLVTRRLSVSKSTGNFYNYAVQDFMTFLGKAADGPLDRIQPEQVEAWRNGIAVQRAKKTANHKHKVLRMVFRSARLRGLITRDPAEAIPTLRRDRTASPRQPFTPEQVRIVLDACPTEEWKTLVLFGLYTGQRMKDLCLLRWSDIQGGVMCITTGKTGRRVRVPLAPPLLEHLKGYRHDGHVVHPHCYSLIQISCTSGSSAVGRQFTEILAKAGLRPHQPHRKGPGGPRRSEPFSFHSLRHTCISMLANAGVPRAVAMEIAGHESSAVHQLYVHVGDEAMIAALAKLPNVGLERNNI